MTAALKILIMNWRDPRSPSRGGAEVATLEHAKRWVGNHRAEVTWLAPAVPGRPMEEIIEGVRVVRICPSLKPGVLRMFAAFPAFYVNACLTYLRRFRYRVDVVIDQVHGIPYLTPFYVREGIVVYLHEVAGEIWDIMYPFPIDAVGRLLERWIFRPYRNATFVCGSDSTKRDLAGTGVDESRIRVINYGVTLDPAPAVPKKDEPPVVMFLNRLVPLKGPEDALRAFARIRKAVPGSRLVMGGGGEEAYVRRLRQLARELDLEECVSMGYLSEGDKKELMGRSAVFINTSRKEGWGLVNLEANSQGTFVVAYRVPGSVDSVVHGINGFLCDPSPEALGDAVTAFLSRSDRRDLYVSALEFSRQFRWDRLSEEFYHVLTKAAGKARVSARAGEISAGEG